MKSTGHHVFALAALLVLLVLRKPAGCRDHLWPKPLACVAARVCAEFGIRVVARAVSIMLHTSSFRQIRAPSERAASASTASP
jgi:hypothetical protein